MCISVVVIQQVPQLVVSGAVAIYCLEPLLFQKSEPGCRIMRSPTLESTSSFDCVFSLVFMATHVVDEKCLLQPPGGWTAAAIDKFSRLVLHRRLKAEILGHYGGRCTVALFAR